MIRIYAIATVIALCIASGILYVVNAAGLPIDASDAWWVHWLVVLFGVPEGVALYLGKPERTLSRKTWKWAAIHEKGRGWRLRRLLLLTLMAWLSLHLLTGGFF